MIQRDRHAFYVCTLAVIAASLEKIALEAIREQRRARQWGILFKLLLFIYLFALLFAALGWLSGKDALPGRHTAMVEIRGVISPDSVASADNIVTGLQEAFKDKRTQGVVLRINSPGGSPVQAAHINDEIRRLQLRKIGRRAFDRPIYSAEDWLARHSPPQVSVGVRRTSPFWRNFVWRRSLIASVAILG